MRWFRRRVGFAPVVEKITVGLWPEVERRSGYVDRTSVLGRGVELLPGGGLLSMDRELSAEELEDLRARFLARGTPSEWARGE